jgi:hypothetical protein
MSLMKKNRLLRPLALGMLAAWAAAAGAQSNPPWYVGVQQTFTHDSNVFRTPANEQSDTISSTALLAGLDLPFGRQHLRVDGLARHDKFSDHGQLDHDGWRASAVLDWATIERLSGRAEVSTRQELARHDVLGLNTGTDRTLQRLDSASFSARLGATSLLAIEGRVGHNNVSYDSPEAAFDLLEYKQNVGSLGVLFRPSGLLTLGAAARVTKGEYTNVGDEYDRKDFDLTATWVPTGISTVRARISATKEEHDARPHLDVSGVTGALQWDWRPTGKLRFVTELARDTGSQIAFSQLLLPTGDIVSLSAPDSRVVTSANLRTFYELTAKIRVDAALRHAQRSFQVLASDRSTLASIGAQWDPTRAIGVGCSLARQSRSSDAANREYDANIASCFARFVLQG